MKFKLPRKLKKQYYKDSVIAQIGYGSQQDFNWIYKKRMVIVHNYTKAGIFLKETKESQQWLKTGLLTNPKFNSLLKIKHGLHLIRKRTHAHSITR